MEAPLMVKPIKPVKPVKSGKIVTVTRAQKLAAKYLVEHSKSKGYTVSGSVRKIAEAQEPASS